MSLVISLLVNGFAVFISSYILQGIHIESFLTAIIVGVVLGVLNTFIKPILVILTLPINVMTFFLFVFVINALLVLLASALIPGFKVDGFWWALAFSLVLSLVGSFLNSFKK
jgi:putative membrane protein